MPPIECKALISNMPNKKENSSMLEKNIRQFMETARQHLLGLIPVQPAFANMPAMAQQVR